MPMVTPDLILSRLPAYRDEWQLIKRRQYVPDIISEVCQAHRLFAPYYDEFSYLFFSTDPDTVCENLHQFCKNFIRYREEPITTQTSAIPTGILVKGVGDCKHYALFNAGVIASLNRCFGCCLEGNFVFAGYRGASEPHHVFVSVLDSEGVEIWLDPTPGSGSTPCLIIEKPL